jgi:hypothetical protein
MRTRRSRTRRRRRMRRRRIRRRRRRIRRRRRRRKEDGHGNIICLRGRSGQLRQTLPSISNPIL